MALIFVHTPEYHNPLPMADAGYIRGWQAINHPDSVIGLHFLA
jgi:hypothetical protein